MFTERHFCSEKRVLAFAVDDFAPLTHFSLGRRIFASASDAFSERKTCFPSTENTFLFGKRVLARSTRNLRSKEAFWALSETFSLAFRVWERRFSLVKGFFCLSKVYFRSVNEFSTFSL